MAPPKRRYWADMTTTDFGPDAADWVAVLPIAAVEQHGPHLPLGTDRMIGEGLLSEAVADMGEDSPAVILPMLVVGKSDEHHAFAGTLTLTAATLLAALTEIGGSLARSAIARLVIINSHGGNSETMALAARELRRVHNMLVVATSWSRLGFPDGLFTDEERRHGIHGGDIETSLMLHLRPDLVAMENSRHFPSLSQEMEQEFDVLRGFGPVSFAWAMEDLNAQGACGDASAATAEKGRAAAAYAVKRFLALLDDVARFDPKRLGRSESR